jgi:hypothetical protein
VELLQFVGLCGKPELMLVSAIKKPNDPANVIYRLCDLFSG